VGEEVDEPLKFYNEQKTPWLHNYSYAVTIQ